ncbi:MAG: hypothetical protein KGO81_11275 [Bacteroidota bacterium]|nr:hypothetical protein [Bacteroidota bacterium]
MAKSSKSSKRKNPTWDEATQCTKAYREYLKGLPIDDAYKTKAFLLTKEQINALMGDNDGIRVYLGLEAVSGGFRLRFFPVAAKENTKTSTYDDVNVPKKPAKTLTVTSTSSDPTDVRPCPDYCSSTTNTLNS